mmetsp:Transcript_6618/g.15051  ORF Transcript_6618/g.15051 Transcript_6618/m.15051 type:complete len:207 (-) Transcript_6618:1507-2127(-)
MVDMSNLHRQVIHQERNVGVNKAISACGAVQHLNPTIRCTPIQEPLNFSNALDLVSRHDCIVDASDNPQTRYLLNDACVLAKKPLVSGSALGTEGQLTVYNFENGPCYRCLYPKPNKAEGCKSCSDNGVLGPVPGLIGVLQSVEVLKVLTGFGYVCCVSVCCVVYPSRSDSQQIMVSQYRTSSSLFLPALQCIIAFSCMILCNVLS